MIDNGVDVVFGAAGLYNQNSALSTAAKRKVYAIGVEVDQYQTLGDARKTLLSSVVKQVAAGVFDLIKSAKQGTFQGGEFLGQVAYAPLHDLADRVPARVKSKMKQIQKKLADGTLDPANPNATPTPIAPKAVKP
jgi:basic membrane protein A